MTLEDRAVWLWDFQVNDPSIAVCSLKRDPEELFLITVYDPSKRPEHWMDRYKRRRR